MKTTALNCFLSHPLKYNFIFTKILYCKERYYCQYWNILHLMAKSRENANTNVKCKRCLPTGMWKSCYAGCQQVSRCHTRDESQATCYTYVGPFMPAPPFFSSASATSAAFPNLVCGCYGDHITRCKPLTSRNREPCKSVP